MTEALNHYLDQCDFDIAMQEEDEEICGDCGCLLPDNGTACECDTEEDIPF